MNRIIVAIIAGSILGGLVGLGFAIGILYLIQPIESLYIPLLLGAGCGLIGALLGQIVCTLAVID